MKVSKENEALVKEITDTSLYWIRAIKAYMEKYGFTQDDLAERLPWEQGTISKKLNEKNVKKASGTYWHLPLSEAHLFCRAMNSTLGAVLYEYEEQNAQNSAQYDKYLSQEYSKHEVDENIPKQCQNIPSSPYTIYPACLFSDGVNLVNNKNDPMFLPWFGKYHCYFYSTLSNEDVCFHGVLDIPKTPMSGCCNVSFDFVYDEKADLHKKYYGQMVLSKKQNGGAYCSLVNHDDQGEITYLVMANPSVKNSSVCCVLAFVATISGGKDTKHPCVERMIISKEPLSGRNFEISKAHLLLNDKYIRITEEAFRSLLSIEDLPESFKRRFTNFQNPFDAPFLAEYLPRMAVIPESWVKSLTGCSEQEHQRIIDLMRLHSLAPRYNKIKQKTAENDIYEMFKGIYEK